MNHARSLSVLLILLAAVLLSTAWHVSVGGSHIPLFDVLRTLIGSPPDARTELAVVEFRLPRTVAALLAGLGLGVAGALTQTVARNPLASPDILGITNGAAFGAVAVMALGVRTTWMSQQAQELGLPAAAALGGIGTAVLVFALAWNQGLESNRLILVGIGMSGFMYAMTTWMLTLGDVQNAQQALTWMSGTINGVDWARIGPLWWFIFAAVAFAALMRRQRELLVMNQDTVTALGMNVHRVRLVTLGLATILAVTATVIAGPLAFVALASGQIARIITRDTIAPVLQAGCVGMLFVLFADLAAARMLWVALPAGIATAVLGAPYLIYLVVRQQRRSTVR